MKLFMIWFLRNSFYMIIRTIIIYGVYVREQTQKTEVRVGEL